MLRKRLQPTATLLSALLMVMAIPQLQGICAAAFTFVPPVDGEVARRFEAPLGPYAAGHRGIDYSVPSGSVVRASSDGTVTFAGPVADDGLFVTIRHEAQIETTYSFMSQVDVSQGQRVRQGDVLGLSGDGHDPVMPGLHFGARIGGEYVDPQLLLIGDLDDVSKFIHLTAIEHQPAGDGLQGPSVFEPPPRDEPADDEDGVFVAMGSGLARFGRWLLGVPGAVGGFVRGAAGSLWDGLRDVGAWLWSGAQAGGRFIAHEVRRDIELLKTFGRMFIDSMKQVWDWVKGPLFAVGRAIRDAVVRVWRGIEFVAEAIWRVVKSLPSRLWEQLKVVVADLLPVRLVKSYVEERKCAKANRGPAIPTTAQMRSGAKPPPPPNDNIVVAVAGIGSWTMGKDGAPKDGASIYQLDFETLGYPEERIFHYSYRGLEDRGGRGPYRLHAPYTKEDTYKSIEESAALLDRQIREIHARYPDKKIDLVAHSQGGLVAQTWLERHYKPGDPRLGVVGHFVTLGSPHRGADAAQLGAVLSDAPTGVFTLSVIDQFAGVVDLPPPTSQAALEMSEGSDFIRSLERNWDPTKVKTTTIAATFDYVVSPPQTRLRGAEHLTVNLPNSLATLKKSHSLVATSSESKNLIYGVLKDGKSNHCTLLANDVANYVVGPVVSGIQDGAIFLVDAVTAR